MSIGEICNREVVFADPDTTIPEVADLMRRYHVGDVVVAEERAGRRHPVGIITDRDLVIELIAKGQNPAALAAKDLVGPELVTARSSDDVYSTLARMREKGVRRMPVVEADGSLAGLVTADDLLDLLAEELLALSRIGPRGLARERSRRP